VKRSDRRRNDHVQSITPLPEDATPPNALQQSAAIASRQSLGMSKSFGIKTAIIAVDLIN
jgi:hypothetical protein